MQYKHISVQRTLTSSRLYAVLYLFFRNETETSNYFLWFTKFKQKRDNTKHHRKPAVQWPRAIAAHIEWQPILAH